MKIKSRIFRIQGGLCALCGEPMQMNTPRKRDYHLFATIEHVLPVSLGGRNHESNYVVTHAGCNSERGNAPACSDLLRVHGKVQHALRQGFTNRQLKAMAA